MHNSAYNVVVDLGLQDVVVNYLAHAFLADTLPETRVGQVAADCLRQPEVLQLLPAVRRGVMQHRHVDSYTDRHAVVHRAIARISERWGWFASIVLDVYFDHLLARNWPSFCETPLHEYLPTLYADLLRGQAWLPEKAAGTVRWLVDENVMDTYRTLAGIENALGRVTRIIRKRMPERSMNLVEAMPDLAVHDDALNHDFQEFFPQLMRFSQEWLILNPISSFTPVLKIG
jgi:acyl carrier protein phosphodiesterase